MLVAFSISPTAADETGGVSAAVAEAVRVVRESGLPCETNAMFTNIEGEWDEVMAVVKRAVDVVAASSPRVGLVLKADIRPGFEGQLTAKVERIEAPARLPTTVVSSGGQLLADLDLGLGQPQPAPAACAQDRVAVTPLCDSSGKRLGARA